MEECGNSIVRELLCEDNYEEWTIQVKTYLLAQGLWDIVKCSAKTPKRHEKTKVKVWTRKNARALHVIQRSCGDASFPLIKDISSAKIAWSTLADEYGRPKSLEHSEAEDEKEKETNEIVQESSSEENEQENNSDYAAGTECNVDFQRHLPLFDAVRHGDWDTAKTPERHEEAQPKAWTRKNARSILSQRSPGDESFPLIKDISPAKIAWSSRSDEYGRPKSLEHSEAEDEKEKETNELVQESSSENNEQENNSDNSSGSHQSGDFKRHRPLFDAVKRGNWDTAKTYLDQHPNAVRARSDVSGRTPLHIAVSAGHLHIVEELVQLMTEEDLLIQQRDGSTVLALSIQIGNIPIAKCLIRKNKEIVSFGDKRNGGLPVVHAVLISQFQMARYLYSVTPQEDLTLRDNGKMGASLIRECIYSLNFDIALDLLKRCPKLALTRNQDGKSPVKALSCCSKSVFRSGCQLGFWQRWVYDSIDVSRCAANQVTIDVQNQEGSQSDKNDLTAIRSVLVGVLARMPSILLQLLDVQVMYETKLLHVQFFELLNCMCEVMKSCSDENQLKQGRVQEAIVEAVHKGNVEFIINVTKANPELLWTNDLAFEVFMLAIELRQAEVFSLIYGLLDKREVASLHDSKGNNMLHKAASIPYSKILNLIPGAALQMQRQLQWYKEVETVLTPVYNEYTNNEFLLPQELFTQNHKELVVAGEKWMKETSSSCTVAGALIVTITFAAAFTVPGGNNQDTGFPIFKNKNLFKFFLISDAMSLFSSATSLLMFLGILTSRYAEEDFLRSLPTKMIIGLSTLFFSIATMMIAFCVSVSMMLQDRWIVVLVSLLASVPVTLFVWIQFPLLVDICMSTYGPSIFNRNVKPWLYP